MTTNGNYDEEVARTIVLLSKDLREYDAPDEMIQWAEEGKYHGDESDNRFPKILLVAHCNKHDLRRVAKNARRGKYDP